MVKTQNLLMTTASYLFIGYLLLSGVRVFAEEHKLATGRAAGDSTSIARILREFHNPKSKHVMVIAHRGGWRNAREYKAPENSLANIDKAVRLGYDVFETDVSRTKDGRLVLMHDPSVARTTNGTGKVRDMTLAEVKKLRLRYAGKKEVTDQTVPIFKEAMELGKDRILFKIDLKCGLACLGQVLDELHEVGNMNQVMTRVGYRSSNVRKVNDVLSRSSKRTDAIILFRCKTPDQVRQIVNQFHPPVIEIQGAEKGVTDEIREMIWITQESGARVEAHASDDPNDWPKQIDAGIRAFHTTHPRHMIGYLREKGLHW